MSFVLDRQMVKLVNINVRNEMHGDEHCLAVDLSLTARLSNNELVQFSPTLKSSLYTRNETAQQELIDDANHLPLLKNPQMGSIKWDAKFDHARSVVHHGIDEKSDIIFADSKLNKFVILAHEGGTFDLSWRVQAHPDELQIAKLTAFLGESFHCSIDSDAGEPDDEPQADFGAAGNEGYANPGESDLPGLNAATDVDPTDVNEDEDELYPKAIETVVREQKASISLIQRSLKIGYNRAARLFERLVEQGVVSQNAGKSTVMLPASSLEESQS